MSTPHPTTDRIITLSATQLSRYTDEDLRDIESYFDPSAVLLTDTSNPANQKRVVSTVESPVIDVTEPGVTRLSETTIVTAPELDDARSLLSRNFDSSVSVVADFIRQDFDPNTFETTLIGLDEYQELVRDRTDIDTHLVTTMSAGQQVSQADIPIFGAGFIQSLEGSKVPCITLGEALHIEELDISKVGLQAIPDIGWKRRQQLEELGYLSRDDLLNTEPADLLKYEGFGPYYAARTTAGARAIERDEPIRFITNPLGNRRRVFVDIETDSLQPQFIWQIGVYDDDSGDYHYFINDDKPGGEDEVVREFAEWVAANGDNATFIAWYGKQFDFIHLTDFIDRHAPTGHAEVWDRVNKFDLLLDFVKSGVATPARSHKLGVVASRLGYEFEYPHLSGAEAAQAYTGWASGQRDMDWEMWISYCRDDVLAMKHVYDAISEAELLIDKQKLERVYRNSSR